MVALLGCHLNHSPYQPHAGIVYMGAVILDFNTAFARFFCNRVHAITTI